MIFKIHLINSLKGRDNLNLLLGNPMTSYNKVGLGYEPINNSKSFRNICIAQQIF